MYLSTENRVGRCIGCSRSPFRASTKVLRKVYRRFYRPNIHIRQLCLNPQTLNKRYRSSQQPCKQPYRYHSSKACVHSGKGTRDLTKRVYLTTLDLLAFRGGSNKFDDVWEVDCFPLACAFNGVTASGRDFFAFVLTGAFKGV